MGAALTRKTTSIRCGAEKSKNRPDAAWTSKTERSKSRNNW